MKLSLIHANSRKKMTLSRGREIILGRGATEIPELEEDSKLSRQHLKFYFDDENNCFVVQDLDSTNGTFLNHNRVDPQSFFQVHVGDIVVFGNQAIEIETIWDDSKILKNTTDFTDKASINVNASLTQEMTMVDHSALYRQFSYEGSNKELIVLSIKNAFFSLISLGFYIPYAKVNLRKHIWGYTRFGPDAFNFAGSGWELLRSYLIFFGLVFFIGAGFWGVSSYAGFNWLGFANHFTERLGFEAMGLVFAFLILSVFVGLFYIAFIFYMQFGTLRYLLTRTKLRSLYFNLDSTKRLNFIVSSLGGILLTIVTLGLYFPFFKTNQLRYLWNHVSYGNQKFQFQGDGKNYARVFLKTLVFAITITILIRILSSLFSVIFSEHPFTSTTIIFILSYSSYFFIHSYFKAESLNYLINNLQVQKATFSSSFTMFQMFKLNFINYILVIVTFGLASPVVL